MKRALLIPVVLFAATAVVIGTAAPASAASNATATELLNSLTVAQPSHASSYSRDADFYTWSDPLGDGCNTRADVLKAQSSVPVIMTTSTGCTLATGQWTSWYDGASWSLASDLQIDHLVPLGEAWSSGAWAWTAQQRENYANDISTGYSLQAVTSSVNESKGDRDPSAWMPPAAAAACQYDQDWVLVKYKWNLTVDAAEKAAIATQLAQNGCGAQTLALPAKAGTSVEAGVAVTPGTKRISGSDRFATAVAISKASFSPGVSVAYVADGLNYPDALSAASAAATAGGPLLLTAPGSLRSDVAAELKRLKPASIVVVGGTASVSQSVQKSLAAYAPTVVRYSGGDRFATSRAIASTAFPSAGTVFVASGLNFPDALSASAAAGAVGAPVILVNGGAGSLDATTSKVIRSMGASKIVIAGGASAVSAGIQTGLRSLGSVTRYGGADRFATSKLINDAFFPKAQQAYLASGVVFPDALAGAAVAGRYDAPLFVIQPGCVPDAIASDMSTKGVVERLILGGTSALSSAVAAGTKCSALAPKPAPAPSKPTPSKPANPGDSKNCSDFATHAAAQAWFNTYYPYYGDVAHLDSDGDKIACENLP
ncbi:cell wall-binding repeat-containing protein [Gryllotalpicola koreensis]|uniref:Excalibur calcium-binding domain-containing protein n=1 Tax=Gryllotalpicola koreensis TaxID=993086 RepID=A0ABP8ACN8_9MICO